MLFAETKDTGDHHVKNRSKTQKDKYHIFSHLENLIVDFCRCYESRVSSIWEGWGDQSGVKDKRGLWELMWIIGMHI